MVDTSDEWIRTRTGIRERRIAGPDESTFTLAVEAGRQALAVAGVAPSEVDLVVVCTFSPEFGGMPSTASLVQDALGAARAGAFDLNAACSGFIYGLALAQGLIASGMQRTVLVDRGGDDVPPPGLERPQHLRPVRRRGRGRAPAGGRRPGRNAQQRPGLGRLGGRAAVDPRGREPPAGLSRVGARRRSTSSA